MPDIVPLLAVYGILLLVLLAFRVWIALALAVVGFVGLVLFSDPMAAGKIISVRLYNSLWHPVLTAIPLFILMAEIIARAGVGKMLYDAVGPITERFLPGGLVQANIVSCAMFGAVCGSAIGGAAAMGGVAVPRLRERGYNMPFAAASIAAAGPLALIIPPSTGFILWGSLAHVSISKLFIAGIIPGIMLAGLMMLGTLVAVKLRPELVPGRPKERLSRAFYIASVVKVAPIVLLAIIIIYSIYGGIATPTETASVGVLGAIIISLAYRQLNRRVFVEALRSTARTTGMIMFCCAGASIFAISLANVGLVTALRDFFVGLPTPPLGTAAILLVVYIFSGMFIDGISMVFIFTPITFPIFMGLGFDPLQAGVISILMGEIGCITPPVGLTLFVMQSLSGEDSFAIGRAGVPFLIPTIVGAFILMFFPILCTLLPSFMG